MSIFTTTISCKIEEIAYYYLCKHTYEIFLKREDGAYNLMISKNSCKNEMTIICKDCLDFI